MPIANIYEEVVEKNLISDKLMDKTIGNKFMVYPGKAIRDGSNPIRPDWLFRYHYFLNSFLKSLLSFFDRSWTYWLEGFLRFFEKLCMSSTVFNNSISLFLSPLKFFRYLSIQGFLPLSSCCE